MNKVAAFALRRKNSILSMSEKMFCPPQPLRFWITPACAGKRTNPLHEPSMRRDHPRVCGEKSEGVKNCPAWSGSPPRVRGKVNLHFRYNVLQGITPAYAGKRCRSPAFRSMPWDHPRVCGEKFKSENTESRKVGSPPRVRGKGGILGVQRDCPRITPAHAGKSCASLR